jgi:hypothetical protein
MRTLGHALSSPSASAIASSTDRVRPSSIAARLIGLPGEAWEIDATLGELYQSRGDADAAAAAFARAAETVLALAGGCGTSTRGRPSSQLCRSPEACNAHGVSYSPADAKSGHT